MIYGTHLEDSNEDEFVFWEFPDNVPVGEAKKYLASIGNEVVFVAPCFTWCSERWVTIFRTSDGAYDEPDHFLGRTGKPAVQIALSPDGSEFHLPVGQTVPSGFVKGEEPWRGKAFSGLGPNIATLLFEHWARRDRFGPGSLEALVVEEWRRRYMA
jgi:hypothetical protein